MRLLMTHSGPCIACGRCGINLLQGLSGLVLVVPHCKGFVLSELQLPHMKGNSSHLCGSGRRGDDRYRVPAQSRCSANTGFYDLESQRACELKSNFYSPGGLDHSPA